MEKILNDYQTMQGNKVQLSIVNKNKLPITIGVQSEYIFDITLKGKYVINIRHIVFVYLPPLPTYKIPGYTTD